ncbi:MAG: hypothetical protein PHU23_12005 [Dehalococcoidales bacterium]|nr:hypothetical protein [Dehalococcoidales bacterium]
MSEPIIRFPKPLAMIRQNVAIHNGSWTKYRRVTYRERLKPFQCINLGAIAVGGQAQRTPITSLDLPVEEFGQVRFMPMDDGQFRFYLPSGIALNTLKNFHTYLDMSIFEIDPELESTELCYWQDEHPSVECINGGLALAASRLKAFGWRYFTTPLDQATIDGITAGNTPCSDIWVSGLAPNQAN